MREDIEGAVVIRGARVYETPASEAAGDLHIRDGVFVEAGDAPGAEVVDAADAFAVPLTVDSARAARSSGEEGVYDLRPGNPATFALIRRPVSESQIRRMLIVNPRDLLAVYVDGHLEVWDGAATRPEGDDLRDPEVQARWVATWSDPGRGLDQHLTADGRYSETRGGREDAYTGRYWVRGERITYLDDSGFWAFGEMLDGTLHHAGFVMSRD